MKNLESTERDRDKIGQNYLKIALESSKKKINLLKEKEGYVKIGSGPGADVYTNGKKIAIFYKQTGDIEIKPYEQEGVCIVPNSHLFPKQSEVMTSHAPRAWWLETAPYARRKPHALASTPATPKEKTLLAFLIWRG
ncbi:MAG: hypothetical protein WDK96_02160 [Candidatus Paceibacterota bacterium]|jgi:hypothetical protein